MARGPSVPAITVLKGIANNVRSHLETYRGFRLFVKLLTKIIEEPTDKNMLFKRIKIKAHVGLILVVIALVTQFIIIPITFDYAIKTVRMNWIYYSLFTIILEVALPNFA